MAFIVIKPLVFKSHARNDSQMFTKMSNFHPMIKPETWYNHVYFAIVEQTNEYCLTETFYPQCLKNEVIVMESAKYGRMKIGKCVKAKEIETLEDDPRYLGCAVDVLSLLDDQCSGKTKCEIRVFDISDEKRQPCFSGLKMHLEASYRCISGKSNSLISS